MAKAKDGDTVNVHYTGTYEDGTVFDSSLDREQPIKFQIGAGQVIPGFEQAVVGMEPGKSKTVNIAAQDAYGEYREDGVMAIERGNLEQGFEPAVGMRVQLCGQDGQIVIARVIDITDTSVTVDANHPMAGKDLTFEIQLVEIL